MPPAAREKSIGAMGICDTRAELALGISTPLPKVCDISAPLRSRLPRVAGQGCQRVPEIPWRVGKRLLNTSSPSIASPLSQVHLRYKGDSPKQLSLLD